MLDKDVSDNSKKQSQSLQINRDLLNQLVQVSEPHVCLLVVKIIPHGKNNVISSVGTCLIMRICQE